MLMLNRVQAATRQSLADIPVPDRTASWRPVSHLEVVNRLSEQARARGLRIVNEKLALKDGAYSPKAGMRVALKGARLFGSFDFAPLAHLPVPIGCTPSIGFINAHDQSRSLRFLSGLRVLVCSNGVAVGEIECRRKHTSGIDLDQEIDKALDGFFAVVGRFPEIHDRMRQTTLSRSKGRALVVELARRGVFSSDKILSVVAEFEAPRHVEFSNRNAWSMYNAVTEVALKAQSPARQALAFRALSRVLIPSLN